MIFDISKLIEQPKEVKLDFSNTIKNSQEFDKYAQAARWGAFENAVGEFELVECTFNRLGYDKHSKINNYHAEINDVVTEKNVVLDHLWVNKVTDNMNPQAYIWKQLIPGDKLLLRGVISKYKTRDFSKLSIAYAEILEIKTVDGRNLMITAQ